MTNYVTSLLRTFAQVLVGYVVTWAAAKGLDIPEQVQAWALGAILAGGIFVWTGLVRWLETRKGTGAFAVGCRGLARLLMLGIATKPAYVPPGTKVEAVADSHGTRSTVVNGANTQPRVVNYASGRAAPTHTGSDADQRFLP